MQGKFWWCFLQMFWIKTLLFRFLLTIWLPLSPLWAPCEDAALLARWWSLRCYNFWSEGHHKPCIFLIVDLNFRCSTSDAIKSNLVYTNYDSVKEYFTKKEQESCRIPLGAALPFCASKKLMKQFLDNVLRYFKSFMKNWLLKRHPKVSFIKVPLLSSGVLPLKKWGNFRFKECKSLRRRGFIHQMGGASLYGGCL